jgi:hypothetical protein
MTTDIPSPLFQPVTFFEFVQGNEGNPEGRGRAFARELLTMIGIMNWRLKPLLQDPKLRDHALEAKRIFDAASESARREARRAV